MLVEEIPDITQQRLLEIRDLGLMTKSGKTEGQKKNPVATWTLTGIGDTELGHLPKLAVTMLTQIWLAHPSIRNQYMILDPLDWDRMPDPLITDDLFKPTPASKSVSKPTAKTYDDLPWSLA